MPINTCDPECFAWVSCFFTKISKRVNYDVICQLYFKEFHIILYLFFSITKFSLPWNLRTSILRRHHLARIRRRPHPQPNWQMALSWTSQWLRWRRGWRPKRNRIHAWTRFRLRRSSRSSRECKQVIPFVQEYIFL